ncbi:divalent-cation tolerance protein CutA [Limimaricola sp. AA108-03]|uniref:divalent-cation tolerance protein CutA n=1 Tax=Limimaricola sp. AA108-03 TaxID=3425945 RepID=UPI003D77741B
MPMLIHTGCDSEKEARKIARALLERRLAAAVHIRRIDTLYRWEGEIHDHLEWRLDIKTVEARWNEVVAAITELHSYEEPAIFSTRIHRITTGALDWLEENCAE